MHTTQLSNITNCSHSMPYVNKMTLTTQYRCSDNHLLNFLQHIRYYQPTLHMLAAIMEGCVLREDNDINDNIYDQLKLHPEATVLTMTLCAATFINETLHLLLLLSH